MITSITFSASRDYFCISVLIISHIHSLIFAKRSFGCKIYEFIGIIVDEIESITIYELESLGEFHDFQFDFRRCVVQN